MNTTINQFQDIKIYKKDRLTYIFLEKCRIDVKNGAFFVYDKTGKYAVPVAQISVIFLQPGTTITHAAIALLSKTETLVMWVGEECVRMYSCGQTQNTKSGNLYKQVELFSNPQKKLLTCKALYKKMFGDITDFDDSLTIEQMRGIEGMKVKAFYHTLSKQYKIPWNNRSYIVNNHDLSDPINKCISTANACLYGLVESVILALNLSPSLGFIHSGNSKSFVYDIADTVKFSSVIPLAFDMASRHNSMFDYHTRIACRNYFKENKTIELIFDNIKSILELE